MIEWPIHVTRRPLSGARPYTRESVRNGPSGIRGTQIKFQKFWHQAETDHRGFNRVLKFSANFFRALQYRHVDWMPGRPKWANESAAK
jgi:hypothetical protein